MIDFHCHVDLFPDPQEIARECQQRKLSVLSVTTTPSAWAGTARLGNAAIMTALGLHPQLAQERKFELSLFDRLLPNCPFVGEIGLDGAPQFKCQWQDQVDVFRHVLKSCERAGGRIMSIHSRHASTAVLDLLEHNPGSGTPILHWFTGTISEMNRAIDIGCWFSVGPAMLRSKRGMELVTRMPPARVLTESDGPFAKVSGQSVLPWHVDTAVRMLAECWELSSKGVTRLLYRNLGKLLNRERFTEPLVLGQPDRRRVT